MASTNGHPAHRIVIVFRRRAALRTERLRDRAFARRVAKSYSEDLDTLLRRLATDPIGWADRRTDRPKLGVVRLRGRSAFPDVLGGWHPAHTHPLDDAVAAHPHGRRPGVAAVGRRRGPLAAEHGDEEPVAR